MVTFFNLVIMCLINFTVKDSDKEHDEEKTIPDCDEEGSYTAFVLLVVSCVNKFSEISCKERVQKVCIQLDGTFLA